MRPPPPPAPHARAAWASWASPTSGATTSRIRFPRIRSSRASWWTAYPTSVTCASAATRRVEVAGECLHRGHDHLGLVDQQPTLRERHPDRLEHLRPQRRGEPGLAVRHRTGLLRGVRPPVRRRRGTRLGLHLHGLGMVGQPGFQLTELGDQPGQLYQRRPGLPGAHRPGRCVPDSLQVIPDPGHHRADRVSPIAGVRGVRHTPIRPPGADTLGPLDRVCGRPPQRVCLWMPSGLFARG